MPPMPANRSIKRNGILYGDDSTACSSLLNNDLTRREGSSGRREDSFGKTAGGVFRRERCVPEGGVPSVIDLELLIIVQIVWRIRVDGGDWFPEDSIVMTGEKRWSAFRDIDRDNEMNSEVSGCPDRRQLLRAGTAAAAVLWKSATVSGKPAGTPEAIAGTVEPLPDSEPPRRVDAHLHCFAGPNDARFPYHQNAPYRPNEVAAPEHLLNCMMEAGVDYAIVVHPEPYQDDHRYLQHCLTVGAERLKGTCLFFADNPDSIPAIKVLSASTSLVAARIHAYAPGRLPPFGTPQLRALWKTAGELGLAVQLHLEPRYAPAFEPLIREFTDITVLIDHLGRPMQGIPREHDVVIRWSRFPNTVMKLSSIPDVRNYPHRDPRHVIRRLIEAYGPDRLIYGGGFGASTTGTSYRAAFEAAREHLTELSEVDQAKILGENAVRLFRFSA